MGKGEGERERRSGSGQYGRIWFFLFLFFFTHGLVVCFRKQIIPLVLFWDRLFFFIGDDSQFRVSTWRRFGEAVLPWGQKREQRR